MMQHQLTTLLTCALTIFVFATESRAQQTMESLDRTTLPIQAPNYTPITELDGNTVDTRPSYHPSKSAASGNPPSSKEAR